MTELTAAQAVAAVMAELGAVAKSNTANAGGRYQYRGIDDLINALAGPMRKHGLVLVPHVVAADIVPMVGRQGWTETRLTVEYDVYGPDGSTLDRPVRAFAVGADNSDKGPGKAMSYAYKTAVSQLLCVPTDDPAMDNEHTEPPAPDPRITEIVAVMSSLPDTEESAAIKAEWKDRWGSVNNITPDKADAALDHALKLAKPMP